jgi:anti-sigma factor RsiW
MSTQFRDAHPDDLELTLLLDEELEPVRRGVVGMHVDGCARCAERLEELRSASALLSGYVAAMDACIRVDELARRRALAAARAAAAPVRASRSGSAAATSAETAARPSRRASTLLRVAAAVTAATVLGLTVEPLAAWIAEARSTLARTDEPALVVAPPVVAEPSASPAITFAATQPTFRIDLARPQTAGEILIQLRDVQSATARIVGGAGEAIVVMPGGLRIENSPASVGSYHLELPSRGIRAVEVHAGGRLLERVLLEGLEPGGALRLATAPPAD